MRPFGLILSLAPLAVVADVQFTSPAAGSSVPAGTISVAWQDSGIAPSIEDLTAYTLILMVGGNEDGNQLALTTFTSQGNFASGNDATGTIPSGIAGPLPNGFFFKIQSSASDGGIVINYSSRFTITGLTGTTDQQYRDAVTALKGATKGPPSVGDDAVTTSSISTTTPATTATSQRSPTSLLTVTRSNTATSIPPSGTGSNSDTGGLSSGVLAGIAIAGVIVGLLGLGFGLLMCLRRKRRKDNGIVKLEDNTRDLSAEVFRKEMTVTTPPVELDPYSRIVEADHGTPPVEMDSMNVRVELEGDSMHMADVGRPDSILTEVPPTPISPMTMGTGTWDSIRNPFRDPIIAPESPVTPVTPRDNV